MDRETLIRNLEAMKREQAEQRQREEERAKDLFVHAVQGWFLMCDGCRAVVAMGGRRDREETCLGASQEGWREINGNCYCPKCG